MATVKAEELRAKTPDELKQQLVELKKEHFNLRFQTASGQVENPLRARVVRAFASVGTRAGVCPAWMKSL